MDQAFIYRGNDPTLSFPEFYGIFFADGKAKKSALTFSLWSELARYHNKIATGGSVIPIQVHALAGQDDAENIGLLFSNTDTIPQPLTLKVKDGGYSIEKGILVSDLSESLQEIPIEDAYVIMPPTSVLFVSMNQTDNTSGED